PLIVALSRLRVLLPLFAAPAWKVTLPVTWPLLVPAAAPAPLEENEELPPPSSTSPMMTPVLETLAPEVLALRSMAIPRPVPPLGILVVIDPELVIVRSVPDLSTMP